MGEDTGRLVKFNLKTKTSNSNSDSKKIENCYALGKLYSDGFFYGFMCAGVDENGYQNGEGDVTHLVTGMYDKDLGLDLIRFPRNPNVAPILYRTLKTDDGFSGKVYCVQKVRFFLLSNELNNGGYTKFVDVGESQIDVDETDMDFYNYSIIRSIDGKYSEFLVNPEFIKFYENSFKEQSIKELHEDIKKCYEETHGEQFGG